MSSYLNIYLEPKKTEKVCKEENGSEVWVEEPLSEGKPLLLCSYTRSSPIYKAFNEGMYVDSTPKIVTKDNLRSVKAMVELNYNKLKKRHDLDFEILSKVYNSELKEELFEIKEEMDELEEASRFVTFLMDILEDIEINCNSFTKVYVSIS